MNLIDSFYASLYDSRVKSNQPAGESPVSANIVLSLCLIVFIGSVIGLIVLFFPDAGDAFEDLLKDVFGRRQGRAIGQLFVIFGIAVFYPIIHFTVGTKERYMRTRSEFRTLPEEKQKQVSRKGAWFVGLTLGSFVVPLLIWMIKSVL